MPTFTPMGDQAVLVRFEREADALQFAASVRSSSIPGIVDVVPAYFAVAVFYDLNSVRYATLVLQLQALPIGAGSEVAAESRLRVIPCCYELGPDLERIASHTGLTQPEVIRLHSETIYTVYAIGFSPGFPYLGYLHEKLCGVPRLPSPRLRVEPGSVGLTGRQTGIYPLERPGGWNLLGRTPLTMVDVADGYFPLRAGDRVQFVPIDRAEFERRKGQRLE